jgi:hypothetical protein
MDALVTEHVIETIIGVPWLTEHRAKWDMYNNKITIGGIRYKLYSKYEDLWCRQIIVADDVIIPSRSEYIVSVNVDYRDKSAIQANNGGQWMTEVREPVRGLHVPHTLISGGTHKVPVTVMNSTMTPITLRASMVMTDKNR